MSVFTILFCAGIIIAKYVYMPIFALFLTAVGFIAISLIFLRQGFSVIFIYLLSAILGAVIFINCRILPANHIAKITPYKSEYVLFEGVVCDYPRQSNDYTTFTAQARQIILKDKLYKTKGKILVKLFRAENIQYGQYISLKGNLFKASAYGKNKHYRLYLRRRGIYSILTVKKDARIEHLGQGRGNFFKTLAYKIRDKANGLIFAHMPFTQAAIFSAMILGDRANIPLSFNKMFIQTGTVHMLAISGFHVGIVAFVLELLLKGMRIQRKARYVIIAVALIFYCLLTGANPPVVRSTLMASVMLLSYFLKREIAIAHSLSLAALIILLINPYQLFDVGFQLSFLSIISLTSISPFIRRFFPEGLLRIRLAGLFIGLLCASVGAWIGLLPFISYYFKIISPITIIANIIIVPYVSLVVILGITFLVTALLFPFCASIFALPASLSAIVLIHIVKFFNNLPFAYFYLR